MSEPTLLAPPLSAGAAGGVVRLEADEARHARALRLGAGSRLALTDGRGRRWSAKLVAVGRDEVTWRLVSPLGAPPRGLVDLRFGVGSRDRTMWLAEEAVELGARTLAPVVCSRSRSVADAGRSARFLAKLERRCAAALKQCGGGGPPGGAPADRAGGRARAGGGGHGFAGHGFPDGDDGSDGQERAMKDCVFCRIAGGELEAERVAEDAEWIAFRDLDPRAPTHVLVIPRRHVRSLDELEVADRELAGTLLLACREIAEREGVSESGYRVVTNTNADGGQSVPHLHFHLLGGRAMRWPPG